MKISEESTTSFKIGRPGFMRSFLAAAAFVLLFSFIVIPRVYAADETAYFGSESYSWEYGETWPIGIYASSSETIDSVVFTVSYDPDMLEFVQGGTLLEDGVIQYTAVDIGSTECHYLLYFMPVCSGSTTVTIESAVITDIYGNITTTDPVSVNVENLIASDALLDTLTVNGTEITGFDEEVLTYSVDVSSTETELVIEYTPDTMETEFSDTALAEGENTVYLYVTGTDGSKACYTLIINFTLAEEEISVVSETETESESVTEAVTEEKSQKTGVLVNRLKKIYKRHKSFCICALVIFVLFIFSAIVDIKAAQRRRLFEKDDDEGQEEPRYGDIIESDDLEIDELFKDDDSFIEMLSLNFASLENEDAEVIEETEDSEEEDKDEIIIDVSHVTMEFKRDKDESTSLKELIIRLVKGQHQIISFKALDDISFSVKKGEVVGIIGTNGSGKSTILKIISGALTPTKGKVKVDKSKVQLLTLGTGFDNELTGRENVYLNGAIIGYSKQFIDEHYDEIVDFAELDGFMDEKVRNYSSGMISRLGFSIATVGDAPEILILDEVMSVGDMFFRKKSEEKIRNMIHGGSTVLIVSHAMSVIKENCTKVIWIEKSHLKMIGTPDKVCKAYEHMNNNRTSK